MKGLCIFHCANSEHSYTQCLTVIIVNQHKRIVQ